MTEICPSCIVTLERENLLFAELEESRLLLCLPDTKQLGKSGKGRSIKYKK